jgi:hypothetical protein
MIETPISKLAAILGVQPEDFAKLDPYFLAGLANDFADHHLAMDACGEILYAIAGALAWPLSEEDQASIHYLNLPVHDLFTDDGFDPNDKARYFTADVSKTQLTRLMLLPGIRELQLCAVAKTTRPMPVARFGDASVFNSNAPPQSKKKKIIGLMDHGCAFAHQHLCDVGRTSTRVLAIWDQDPSPEFDPARGSRPKVAGLQYGRQMDRAALKTYLGAGSDREVYRAARYSALENDFTHGTLTLGLLAGQYLSPSLAQGSGLGELKAGQDMDDVDIVFVQIPRAVGMCPSRGAIDRISYDALRYMLACAQNGSDVVVVLDYGTELGPHDGSSWFERAVDQLVSWAKNKHGIRLKVVFPSGNSHDDQRHAKMKFVAAGTTSSVYLDVPYGNGAAASTEIWFPPKMQAFMVSVTAPGHTIPVQLALTPGIGPLVSAFAGGTLTVTLQNGQPCVLLEVGATETIPSLAGRWCIGIFSPKAQQAPVCLYTAWGGRNPGFVQRLWPCRFESAQIETQDILPTMDGSGSLLGSACGQSTTMVGGYEKWRPHYRAAYSGGGPARGGRHAVRGADVLCVVNEVSSLPGVLTMGAVSGPWYRASGTSFAAPQWARAWLSPPLAYQGVLPLPPPYFGISQLRSEYGEPRLL